MTVTPVSPAERQTITTKTKVAENGKIIYSEEATRHYVRETANGPLVEDKSKAVVQSSGQMPNEETVKNAEKEYAAMKQFEAQTQQATTSDKTAIAKSTQTATAGVNTARTATSADAIQPTSPRPLGQPITQTNVEVIVPNGVVLTEAERAYIEQLATSAEGQSIQLPTGNTAQQNVMPGNGQAPVMAQPQNALPQNAQMQPIPAQGAMQPMGQPMIPVIGPNGSAVAGQPITITPDATPVKEEQTSWWDNITNHVNKWLYF